MRSSGGDRLLLLDTHYWVWLQAGTRDQFTPRILTAIEDAANSGSLLLSVISVWELGMLESKKRVQLDCPCEQWVTEALAMPGLQLVPLTPEIALDSSRLPEPFHGDPADRIIVATARRNRASLITQDRPIRDYGKRGHVRLL